MARAPQCGPRFAVTNFGNRFVRTKLYLLAGGGLGVAILIFIVAKMFGK